MRSFPIRYASCCKPAKTELHVSSFCADHQGIGDSNFLVIRRAARQSTVLRGMILIFGALVLLHLNGSTGDGMYKPISKCSCFVVVAEMR